MDILLVNASPRTAGHTAQLLDAAAGGIAEAYSLNVRTYSLAGKAISPCQGCLERCRTLGDCDLADDWAELAALWRQADGVVLGTPVYTFAPPSHLCAFFERLRVVQQSSSAPSPAKAVGMIVQGGSEYGGAEVAGQALLSLVLAAGGVPVSGDMPGSSQGVFGQMSDYAPPSPSLLPAASRLGVRVAEMAAILAAGRDPGEPALRLAIAVSSPRRRSVADALLQSVVEGAREQGISALDTFCFDAHDVAACQACTQYCSRDHECVFDDGMQAFRQGWLAADAILWIVESDYGGPSGRLRAAIDRMNQVRFETHFALRQPHMPRYLRAAGAIAFGVEPAGLGGALQFLQHCALLYQDVPVVVDSGRPGGLAGLGLAIGAGELPAEALAAARSLGRRTIQVAAIVRAGVERLADQLPAEYRPSRSQLGQCNQ